MSTDSILHTNQENVFLRRLSANDAELYVRGFSGVSEEEIDTPFVRAHIERTKEALSSPGIIPYGIWDDEVFAGNINLMLDQEGTEIGYWIDERYRGRGYASLATNALAKHAKERYGRVYAVVEGHNRTSAEVLKKSGFSKTALIGSGIEFELLDRHIEISGTALVVDGQMISNETNAEELDSILQIGKSAIKTGAELYYRQMLEALPDHTISRPPIMLMNLGVFSRKKQILTAKGLENMAFVYSDIDELKEQYHPLWNVIAENGFTPEARAFYSHPSVSGIYLELLVPEPDANIS